MKTATYIMTTLLILGLSMITTSAPAATTGFNDGPIARNELMSVARTLLKQEKFKELDAMAAEFRSRKTRFPDGQWKLFHFYKGVAKPEKSSEDEWNGIFIQLERWSKASPESLTARVATAEAWLNYAWDARGTGLGNTVSDEAYRLYTERVRKAYGILQGISSRSGDCPHGYQLILRVGHNEGWERQRYSEAFKRAVAFEPGYHEYYVSMANYLRPHWHGAEGEWQKFAEIAVKLTPQSEGMTVYPLIVSGLWQKGNTWKSFEEAGISWPMMKQGFLDMEKNYPDSRWNLNMFCFYACLAGDCETARKLFERIGDTPYLEAWQTRELFASLRQWAMQ